jgi:hypothetical protein
MEMGLNQFERIAQDHPESEAFVIQCHESDNSGEWWQSLMAFDTLGLAKDMVDDWSEDNPHARFRIMRVKTEVARP